MNQEEKKELVKTVQRKLNLVDDGVDGEKTWTALANYPFLIEAKQKIVEPAPSSKASVSPKALSLILENEVGGGINYYNKRLKNPTYPGGGSGLTIGIGYDLGYNTLDQFSKDWKDKLSEDEFFRLKKCLGAKGPSVKSFLPNVFDIIIPWEKALKVFMENTLPRFEKETISAFPGVENLTNNAYGALVSLVFNRGGSIEGPRRAEMANIKKLVPQKDYDGIAKEIVKMKRLWVGQDLDGLLSRRDSEAALVKTPD